MKILIYGENYWYGIAPPLKSVFETLGHVVDLFDWTSFLYRSKEVNLKNRIFDKLFKQKVMKAINKYFIKQIENIKYDFILVLQGVALLPETVLFAKKYCKNIANWNIDDFFNSKTKIFKYNLNSFNKYDCIFSVRKHLFARYLQQGAKRVEHLLWFYYPEKQYRVTVPPEEVDKWGSDISFLGTWSKHRENVLLNLKGFNLKIWGNYWNRAQKQFKKEFIVTNSEAWFEEM